MSDDGELAIVIIALLGNPFSPEYARARTRANSPANALHFASMNVALYAKGASAWTLDERVVQDGQRTATGVTIGASTMRWQDERLVVDIDERTSPLRRRVRGRVVLTPEAYSGLELAIDEHGAHRWWPVAPLARIDVDFQSPGVRFSGHGYHDANTGDVPMEQTFLHWSWSRARSENRAIMTYDVACVSGATRSLAFSVATNGERTDLENVATAPIARTGWGLDRTARVDEGAPVRVVRSLEDGPFYARALVETKLGGEPVIAMHETLAAHRLKRLWVRTLTRFRMRNVT